MELRLGAVKTADRLQQRMPYMHLSPSWCIMCESSAEFPGHLFMPCLFASPFWIVVFKAFEWPMPFANNVYDLLASVFVGHPFCDSMKILWLALIHVFLWHLWGERNGHTFKDVSSSFDHFMNMVL